MWAPNFSLQTSIPWVLIKLPGMLMAPCVILCFSPVCGPHRSPQRCIALLCLGHSIIAVVTRDNTSPHCQGQAAATAASKAKPMTHRSQGHGERRRHRPKWRHHRS
jgi:hypothetical protein